MKSASRMLLLAAALILPACGTSVGNGGGSGSGGSGAKCAADGECQRGEICESGSCALVQCTSITDCGGGARLCVDGACTGIECTESKPCSNGGTCVSGLCEGGTVVTTGGGTGGDTGGDTGGGDTGATVDPGACDACADTSECVDGLVCTQVGPSKHCVAPCADDSQCMSGWTCYVAPGADASEAACVPGAFQCKGCLLDGCPDAEASWCNAATGQCTKPLAQCDICTNDGQCGAGQRCLGEGTDKACAPECADGTCPANGTCVTTEGGVKVCQWKTLEGCCFGEDCVGTVDPCSECGGATPQCDAGQCVQCLDDSHCSGDTPKCQAGACVAGQTGPDCSGAAPVLDPATNTCVECLNSSHCNGNPCVDNTCDSGNQGDQCATCVAPYPGCAEFQGQWVCVQCSDDTHCNGSSCNLETYTCEGTTGQGPASGNCPTDPCADGMTCDTGTGLCFDGAEGTCDNTTAFCPNGGACLDFFTQIGGGGGGGGGIPGLPEGGGLASNCECQLGAGELPGLAQGDCPDGLNCGPSAIAGLLALLNPGSTPANVCSKPLF